MFEFFIESTCFVYIHVVWGVLKGETCDGNWRREAVTYSPMMHSDAVIECEPRF